MFKNFLENGTISERLVLVSCWQFFDDGFVNG
jgi:hypothetical protein